MTGSAAAKPMGGRRPYALAGERDWLLARIAEKPNVTLRGLVAELAERGIKVSYFAVWHFFEHEGISFKKKRARQRAGPAERRPPARPLEAPSGPALEGVWGSPEVWLAMQMDYDLAQAERNAARIKVKPLRLEPEGT